MGSQILVFLGLKNPIALFSYSRFIYTIRWGLIEYQALVSGLIVGRWLQDCSIVTTRELDMWTTRGSGRRLKNSNRASAISPSGCDVRYRRKYEARFQYYVEVSNRRIRVLRLHAEGEVPDIVRIAAKRGLYPGQEKHFEERLGVCY
jgi:hypothetical protein